MKTTRLNQKRIVVNLQKNFILCLLFLFLTSTAGATEYIVEPIPGDQFGVPLHGDKVVDFEVIEIPYWQFLLWLAIVYVSTAIDLLYPKS